jgi:hypothetical protein
MYASAARDPLWLEKSSLAELPLNLTWNIYAFPGSFASLRMTARFKGGNFPQARKLCLVEYPRKSEIPIFLNFLPVLIWIW